MTGMHKQIATLNTIFQTSLSELETPARGDKLIVLTAGVVQR